MKDKETAEQLRQQREWLSVTLQSIGDAVIATDREGACNVPEPGRGAGDGLEIRRG